MVEHQLVDHEAENVVHVDINVWPDSITDIFDKETWGTIEKVVNELNSSDDVQNNSVSVVSSLLDDMHVVNESKISGVVIITTQVVVNASQRNAAQNIVQKARFYSVSLENSLFVCQTS